MNKVERLTQMASTLQEMSVWVMHFDRAYRELMKIKQSAETDWMMMHYDEGQVRGKGESVTRDLLEARKQVMMRQDCVTGFLNENGIPSQWVIFIAPALGGGTRTYNIFDSYIQLTGMDADNRPTLIDMTDVLDKGLIACRRQLKEYSVNPPNQVTETLRAAPRAAGTVFSWFFPIEKQRAVLGWIVIASLLLLVLRYLLGIHVEDAGKILVKWFRLDK